MTQQPDNSVNQLTTTCISDKIDRVDEQLFVMTRREILNEISWHMKRVQELRKRLGIEPDRANRRQRKADR